MPLLRSIEKTADGFIITRSNGTTLALTSADVPSNVKSQPIGTVEAWVNDWLASHDYNAVCRINSMTPVLDMDVCIGITSPVSPPPSWRP